VHKEQQHTRTPRPLDVASWKAKRDGDMADYDAENGDRAQQIQISFWQFRHCRSRITKLNHNVRNPGAVPPEEKKFAPALTILCERWRDLASAVHIALLRKLIVMAASAAAARSAMRSPIEDWFLDAVGGVVET